MQSRIQLSPDLSIDAVEYAVNGNAVLGIRDSGKTYTGTKIAEQLLDCGIPFVAFDPIGVWKYLRVGKNGKGYPVVVAGTDGDIPLSESNVEAIVRAAMNEDIPLVLDLYSILNKSHWRRIVKIAVLTLLMENSRVRHIFIEEAAEFIPQKVHSEVAEVYGVIESLARMGGNRSLGYTLINQRAEDVNKSILEICERLIVHCQSGKNSLRSLEDWFKVSRIEPSQIEQMMKTIPALPSGEAWICSLRSHIPIRTKIDEKTTVHPNRRDPKRLTKGIATDVTGFVGRLKSYIEEHPAEQPIEQKAKGKIKPAAAPPAPAAAAPAQVDRTAELQVTIAQLREDLSKERSARFDAERRLKIVQDHLRPEFETLSKLFAEVKVNGESHIDAGVWQGWLDKLGSEKVIIKILLEKPDHRATKKQLMLLSKLGRETVRIYTQKLKAMSLLKIEGDDYLLEEIS